jgi:ACR3 family arsenite efflux pump ArsB
MARSPDLPPPDLSTREGQAAYREELFKVARPLRLIGLTFTIIGILFLFEAQGWHSMTERTFALAGFLLIALGWSLMIAGIVKRALYHKKRMRGLG